MNNNFEIEELQMLDDEALEIIEKGGFTTLPFPAVVVTKHTIYFNRHASSIVPQYIEWATTTNYIIGMPTSESNANAYKIKHYGRGCSAAFPATLRNEKKLQTGVFKIYKYKNGFAFSRYEQVK